MDDFAWLQLISCLSGLIFLSGVGVKAFRYSKMPIHLRWDLSPMGFQENRQRGRSRYERLEGWKQPQEKNLLREAGLIAKEILFLRQVYLHDRRLWYFGYPLHLGFYFYILWIVLLSAGAIFLPAGGGHPEGSRQPSVFDLLILGTGIAGFILGTIGSIGLFIRRLIKEDLRRYTHFSDYLNLGFISIVFISGLASWGISDHTFSIARSYIHSLLVLMQAPAMSTVSVLHVLFASIFFAYLPFTTMMHFVAKFFSFHKVRWDDEPNLAGSQVENKLKRVLQEKVTWLAPHASSGKTWKELTQGEKADP